MTPEKTVENEILEWLKMKGIFCFKINSTGIYDAAKRTFRKNKNPHIINGISDVLGILPNGRFLAIEVKKPATKSSSKGYATDNQKFFIANVVANGGFAMVARSVREVEEALRELKLHDSLPPFKFTEGPLK